MSSARAGQRSPADPEVDAFHKETMALADGPPTFGNCDVSDENTRYIGRATAW
jgi:hypothetical protein